MAVLKMADIALSGKRVLIREDLNVPVDGGVVTSDARIRAALPTIEAALAANAAVMLVSHLGRPTAGEPEARFSLRPVADCLGNLLGREVPLIDDWIDAIDVAPGDVVLLENVRFLHGEKTCDDALAKKMAALCDVWRPCATSSSWTLSVARTARTPAPTVLHATRRSPVPARCWRRNSKRSARP
jgi:phosphoglycerate kinase